MIGFNGYMSKTRKYSGEGIYVQNQTNATRIVRNNTVYHTYYKGIEMWSAGKRKDFDFSEYNLKNTLDS